MRSNSVFVLAEPRCPLPPEQEWTLCQDLSVVDGWVWPCTINSPTLDCHFRAVTKLTFTDNNEADFQTRNPAKDGSFIRVVQFTFFPHNELNVWNVEFGSFVQQVLRVHTDLQKCVWASHASTFRRCLWKPQRLSAGTLIGHVEGWKGQRFLDSSVPLGTRKGSCREFAVSSFYQNIGKNGVSVGIMHLKKKNLPREMR